MERAIAIAAGAACTALVVAKAFLATRLNVNWDEFFFLTHVHALERGTLDLVLQGAFTHAFRWLVDLPGGEMAQIVAARHVMTVLLGVTALLVYALARRWASAPAAALAALAYLASWSAMKHGASFRADSLLAPLTAGALLAFTSHGTPRRGAAIAGLLMGAAFAVSIKAALAAPVFVALAFAGGDAPQVRVRRAATRLVLAGLVATIGAGGAIGLHALSLATHGVGAVGGYAADVAHKTLVEVPWFPRRGAFAAQLRSDTVAWLLLAGGAAVAAWRRSPAVATALALAPIVFYRNAFPYYYVVMLAPAIVLVAIAADALARTIARLRSREAAPLAHAAIGVLLALQGCDAVRYLAHDEQAAQRATLAAVHAIFPSPVPYIDHSGMVASFPKANFFMSTWGLEKYRDLGRPFVPAALAERRPPLLLANRPVLVPGTLDFRRLLPEDQQLLARHYLDYWGPVRIAGAAGTAGATPLAITFPFGGHYRLEALEPVLIDGRLSVPGTVVAVPDGRLHVSVASPHGRAVPIRLLWAAARPPPAETPPTTIRLYTGL